MIPGTGTLLLAAAAAGGGGAAGGLATLLAQAATDPAGLGIGDAIQGGGTVTAVAAGFAFFKSTHGRALARIDVLERREAERGEKDAAYAREKARADRVERKLDELTRTMIERVAPVLADATRTLVDATTAIRTRS